MSAAALTTADIAAYPEACREYGEYPCWQMSEWRAEGIADQVDRLRVMRAYGRENCYRRWMGASTAPNGWESVS